MCVFRKFLPDLVLTLCCYYVHRQDHAQVLFVTLNHAQVLSVTLIVLNYLYVPRLSKMFVFSLLLVFFKWHLVHFASR